MCGPLPLAEAGDFLPVKSSLRGSMVLWTSPNPQTTTAVYAKHKNLWEKTTVSSSSSTSDKPVNTFKADIVPLQEKLLHYLTNKDLLCAFFKILIP